MTPSRSFLPRGVVRGQAARELRVDSAEYPTIHQINVVNRSIISHSFSTTNSPYPNRTQPPFDSRLELTEYPCIFLFLPAGPDRASCVRLPVASTLPLLLSPISARSPPLFALFAWGSCTRSYYIRRELCFTPPVSRVVDRAVSLSAFRAAADDRSGGRQVRLPITSAPLSLHLRDSHMHMALTDHSIHYQKCLVHSCKPWLAASEFVALLDRHSSPLFLRSFTR